MKISFVIPVYKVERYLHTCVTSIFDQSYKDIEVILVDDGSPDNCPKLCDEIAQSDSRVKVIHKRNGGLSSARNEGLKVATGEYVVFLDSDDWWSDNEALTRIVSKINMCHPDVVIFGGRKYYTRDDKYSGDSKHLDVFANECIVDIEQLMRHSAFLACAWDKVVKRSVLVENGIYFRIGQLSEDIEWCSKLLLLNLKYAVVSGDIHIYRQQNSSSITANITNKNLRDIKQVVEEYSQLAKDSHCEPLLHFLSLEYLLWLAITPCLSGEDGRIMKMQMGKNFWLFDYNWYPRIALLRKIKFLGYHITSYLITLALHVKRVRKFKNY